MLELLGSISGAARLSACAIVLVLAGMILFEAPFASAENLPVTMDRYAQACTKTGGAITRPYSGTGVAYCTWTTARDRTECKVGSSQVNRCMIRCSSNACINANPDKDHPVWPLSGGPKRFDAPLDTLPTQQMAPVN